MIAATLWGALLALVAHFGFLAALAPAGTSDVEAAINESLRPLAPDLMRFQIGLAIAVVAQGALIGFSQSALRRFSGVLKPISRMGRIAADLLCTLAVFTLLLLRDAGAHPALYEVTLGALIPVIPPPVIDAVLAALVFVPIAIGLFRRRTHLRSHVPVIVVVVVLVNVLGLVLLFASRPVPRGFGRPHVVLLVADSLRPDRISMNGHTRPTTPNIDRFAARAATFDDAISPLARTVPAWISILTGLYPHSHGVRHVFPTRARRLPTLPSVARAFRNFGYRTVAISDFAGDFFPTFDLGFDELIGPRRLDLRTIYEREVLIRSPVVLALFNNPLGRALFPVIGFMPENAEAARLATHAKNVLLNADEPLFVVVFFSTTHIPWAPSYPFTGRFRVNGYNGPYRSAYLVHSLADISKANRPAPEADVEQIRAIYDNALSEVDAAMGTIFDVIDREPGLRESVVMVTADHGAALSENGGGTLHGDDFVNDLSNRVPWLVRAPGVVPSLRIPETVSLVDLAPTLAELAGIPFPFIDGASHARLLRGDSSARPTRPAFAETGLWLTGSLARGPTMRYPRIERLLSAGPDDGFLLSLLPRHENRVVEAKHRLVKRGRDRLVYSPTQSGVVWNPPQSPLRDALLDWLSHDPLRVRDARDHFIRNDSP
ncbi:MAG: sulfatase [Deltaproteobacteria bacterium]|nr:sulfatase [Deltaproteobacteria bacterium]